MHSDKYLEIKGYYDSGLWTDEQVTYAVFNGWITSAEFAEITGETYEAPEYSLPTALPSVSASDNGKSMVVASGRWTLTS